MAKLSSFEKKLQLFPRAFLVKTNQDHYVNRKTRKQVRYSKNYPKNKIIFNAFSDRH